MWGNSRNTSYKIISIQGKGGKHGCSCPRVLTWLTQDLDTTIDPSEDIWCSFDVALAPIHPNVLTWPIQDVFFCPGVNIFVWIQNTFVCDVANRICSFEIQPDCVLSNTTIFHSLDEIKLNCVLLKQPLLWWLRALSLLMDNNLVKTWISLAWIGKLFVCDTSYS